MSENEPVNCRLTSYWSLDSLRVYGALSVVLVHALEVATRLHVPGATFEAPSVGLDLFFIISGFLVWQVTRRRESSPSVFLVHRITRIAPLYTVLTLAYAPFVHAMPVSSLDTGVVDASHVVLSLLYVPHRDSAGFDVPVIGPGWTLVYDMYFFVLFALVLGAPKHRQLRWATLVFLLPPILHVVLRPQNIVLSTYTNIPCVSFLIGIWMAEVMSRGVLTPWRLAMIGSTLAGGLYVGLCAFGVHYRSYGALLWIMVAALSVWSSISIEAAGRVWLKLPFCKTLARWSYAIYLCQVFAIPIAIMYVPGGLFIKVLAALVLSIILGAAAHHGIEQPINAYLKRVELRHGLGGRRGITIAP